MKHIHCQVEQILKTNTDTRSSDMKLIYCVLKKYYGIDSSTPFVDVCKRTHEKEIPSFESITRARRKLQEGGKYTATMDVARARKQLEKDYKTQMTIY